MPMAKNKTPQTKKSLTKRSNTSKKTVKTATKAATKTRIRQNTPARVKLLQKRSSALAAKKAFSKSLSKGKKVLPGPISSAKKAVPAKHSKPVSASKQTHPTAAPKNSIKNLAKDKKAGSVATPTNSTLRSVSLGKGAREQIASSKAPTSVKSALRNVSKETGAKNVMKRPEISEETKKLVLSARKRVTTPAFVRAQQRKATPIVFTLEDVREILDKRGSDRTLPQKGIKRENETPSSFLGKSKPVSKIEKNEPSTRSFAAASIADILGFNPQETKKRKPVADVSDRIPKKFLKYYNLLIKLREHVANELNTHSEETLKRSSKEDSGDISSYSQHLADAGTDTFDRDFALSLVSSEQEALNEIEDAIQRMLSGSYGVCEITGDKISHDRLTAVPFTRFSLEGQRHHEKTQRKTIHRAGIFGSEATVAEATHYSDEES